METERIKKYSLKFNELHEKLGLPKNEFIVGVCNYADIIEIETKEKHL